MLGLLLLAALRSHPPASDRPSETSAAPSPVTLEYEWRTSAGGIIMEADFVIRNGADFPVKDVRIDCTHYSLSGSRVDSNSETLYQVFPAHGKVRKRRVNMGFIHSQAESTKCVIARYSPVASS